MPDEQPKPITITFPDGQTMKRVVNILTPHHRPSGWSRKSYSPYFKEKFALWIQPALDDMILSKENKFFPYENFQNVKHSSLYQRIHMAARYLIENMDPDGKYNKLWQEIRLDRTHPKGIVMRFMDTMGGGKIEDIVPVADAKPRWLDQMNAWLENEDDKKPFIRDNLMLTAEQIRQLNLELGGLANLMFSVTVRQIKILKT